MLGEWVSALSGRRLLNGVDATEAIEQALAVRALERAREQERAAEQARERDSFEALARRVAEFVVAGGGISPAERLLTRAQVAELLQCSERTVQRMEVAGNLRRSAGFSRLVRFDRNEVMRLVAGRDGVAS